MESSSAVDPRRVDKKKEYPALLDELLRSAGIDTPKKITVTPELVRFLGPSGAMMLNQILYWHVRGNKSKGFFKSDAAWSKELGLKRSAIIGARATLEAMQIIQTPVKKTATGAPTNHYKLDFERLKTQFSYFMTVPPNKWDQILKTYKVAPAKKRVAVGRSVA